MDATVMDGPLRPDSLRQSRLVLVLLGLGLAGLLLLFRTEVTAALDVWYDSTAYGHCYFVIPIAAWLGWERRDQLAGLAPRPTAWPALLALPIAAAWFVAERLGLMEGRQLALLCFAEIMVLCMLGWRLYYAAAIPLLYLFFLVPFGAFLTPTLQHVTANFVELGLNVLGIPNFVDEFTIEIPEGVFYVAEACAGLRFLIAAIAFGVVYACTIYRSPGRRIAFIAASCVIPIIANGLRALGIVVVGHLIGSAEAAAADHLIYGWIFFSVVILLLIAAGLPFRQDGPDDAPQAEPSRRLRLPTLPPVATASALLALIAAFIPAVAGPLVSQTLDDTVPPAPHFALPAFVGNSECVPAASDGTDVQHFVCGAALLDARVRVLSPGVTWATVTKALRDATGETNAADAAASGLTVPGAIPPAWRLVELRDPPRLTATALWINGAPATGGLAPRLGQALNNLTGGGKPPVIVAVGLQPRMFARAEDRQDAHRVIATFLQQQTALLGALPTALSGTP